MEVRGDITGSLADEGIMAGMSLLMEDEPMPPDPSQLNRAASSKYSREMLEEDYRYCNSALIQSSRVASRCESCPKST